MRAWDNSTLSPQGPSTSIISCKQKASYQILLKCTKHYIKKEQAQIQSKALKAPVLFSGLFLLDTIKRQWCWGMQKPPSQLVSPGKCQLISHCTLTSDLLSLILNTQSDGASTTSLGRCFSEQHILPSGHCFITCCPNFLFHPIFPMRIIWKVFCDFPPIPVAR